MILIPPTHGRAGVRTINAREYVLQLGEEGIRQQMLYSMNRLFQDEFGADVPEAWLSWEVVDTPGTGEVDIRLAAEAPLRANTVWLAPLGEARTITVPVTDQSRIPIVQSPYRYADDNPFRKSNHVLTFAGWDAETGLMVFDR